MGMQRGLINPDRQISGPTEFESLALHHQTQSRRNMKPEVKEIWVNALLSGEYQQGHGALRKRDEFCCLGVLCDLAVQAKVIAPETMAMSDGRRKFFGYEDSDRDLPQEVMEWAGVKDSSGVYEDAKGSDRNLAFDNDKGKKFPEIAKIIESKPKGLFVEGV